MTKANLGPATALHTHLWRVQRRAENYHMVILARFALGPEAARELAEKLAVVICSEQPSAREVLSPI